MKKSFWYKFYISECPLCGRSDSYKERKYTKKPKNAKNRYKYEQHYDYCQR